MHFFKKSGLYILIFLIAISIYNDLSLGTLIPSNPHEQHKNRIQENKLTRFQVKKVKIKPGDTVLSIVEKLNKSIHTLDMQQILHDFKLVNKTNPQEIEVGKFYYFPLYKD